MLSASKNFQSIIWNNTDEEAEAKKRLDFYVWISRH